MKATLTLISALVFSFSLCCAQTVHIATDRAEVSNYDTESASFLPGKPIAEGETLFTLNGDGGLFHHTTLKTSSDYFIESQTIDKTAGTYEYDVVSDKGNRYLFMVDLRQSLVKVVTFTQGQYYLVSYHIKNSWEEQKGNTQVAVAK